MLNEGISKYFSNPVIGLLPYMLYVILHATSMSEPQALAISLFVAIVGEISIQRFFRTRTFSLTFYIVSLAFILTFVFWLLDKYIQNSNVYIIVCEAIMVIFFFAIKLNKGYISMRFRKKGVIYNAYLHEFYVATTLARYLLTIHLFSVLLYQFFRIASPIFESLDVVFYTIFPILIVVCLIIYEGIKLRVIIYKLKKEEWLPIIDMKGNVIGKVARTVSLNCRNKYMHPIVRIALISNGKVFLQERRRGDYLDPGKIDYPFEKYTQFGDDIEKTVQNCLAENLGTDFSGRTDFVMKYHYENALTNRIICLYAIYVEDESSIRRTELMNGKFWTMKQVDQGFADEVFAENFELEYEYLKNMVIIPKMDSQEITIS